MKWSLLITHVRQPDYLRAVMSISLRATLIPASEEIFSCKTPSTDEYCAVRPRFGGVVAIVRTEIITGECAFVAVMANARVNPRNSLDGDVRVSALFRYLSNEPAQFLPFGRPIRAESDRAPRTGDRRVPRWCGYRLRAAGPVGISADLLTTHRRE
jgi:hypothetical protein